MNKHLIKISRSPHLRSIFRKLKLHCVYNAWLNAFPRIRKKNGIVYRSKRTEGVSLAIEVMEGGNCYELDLLPDSIQTFADIGCNVGYFACHLATKYGKGIAGVMIDANQNVIDEANWHKTANQLNSVHVLKGIVGSDSDSFYVFEADTCSTAELGPAQERDKKRFHQIKSNLINFSAEWRKEMGWCKCDVLKIDIEGAEMKFLKDNQEFLQLVENIFIEWHKYKVSFEEMNAFLESKGFKLVKIIEDIGLNGTALYKRQNRH